MYSHHRDESMEPHDPSSSIMAVGQWARDPSKLFQSFLEVYICLTSLNLFFKYRENLQKWIIRENLAWRLQVLPLFQLRITFKMNRQLSLIIIFNTFFIRNHSHILSALEQPISQQKINKIPFSFTSRHKTQIFCWVYKRKDKNLHQQTPYLIYNVQYSFNNTFTPPKHMSNAYVSLHHIMPKQESPQNIMLSLYSKLSLEEEPQKVHELASEIFFFIQQVDEEVFQASLQLITKLFSKGYANLIAESPGVINKIMKHFILLFKMHEQHQTKQLKYRKLFVLSVIAELIRQEPKCFVPFSRDFLLKVFEIEAEDLELSSQRDQLLAILGAIFGNLSKQAKLIKEFKLGKQFKMAILNNYSFIEESSTFRLFNQAILQAQIRGASFFTLCELERYKIKEMLSKTLPEHQTSHLNQYLEKIFPRTKENKGRTN